MLISHLLGFWFRSISFLWKLFSLLFMTDGHDNYNLLWIHAWDDTFVKNYNFIFTFRWLLSIWHRFKGKFMVCCNVDPIIDLQIAWLSLSSFNSISFEVLMHTFECFGILWHTFECKFKVCLNIHPGIDLQIL